MRKFQCLRVIAYAYGSGWDTGGQGEIGGLIGSSQGRKNAVGIKWEEGGEDRPCLIPLKTMDWRNLIFRGQSADAPMFLSLPIDVPCGACKLSLMLLPSQHDAAYGTSRACSRARIADDSLYSTFWDDNSASNTASSLAA
jgi:hypothetical protein